VLDGLTRLPETLVRVLELEEKLGIVSPGDFRHDLRQILPVQFSNSLLEILARRFSHNL